VSLTANWGLRLEECVAVTGGSGMAAVGSTERCKESISNVLWINKTNAHK